MGVNRMRPKKKLSRNWAESPAFSAASLRFKPDELDPDAQKNPINLNAIRITDNDLLDAAKQAKKRIANGQPARIGRKFRRLPQENRGTRFISSIRVDQVSAEMLKMHADMRRVHMSVLISDILNGWLETATDYQQLLWKAVLPEGVRGASVPERYVGYLASLGFAPLSPYADFLAPPPPKEPAAPPPPEASPQAERAELPTPPTPPPAPPSEPIAAQNVPIPVADDFVAAPGWGSAAQMLQLGHHPGRQTPVQYVQEVADDEVRRLREQSAASRAALNIPDEAYGAKRDG